MASQILNMKYEFAKNSASKAQWYKIVTTRLSDSDFMTRFKSSAYGSYNMIIALYSSLEYSAIIIL